MSITPDIPDIPDIPDMPDMLEEADEVADMPLMSMEVEDAIAMVLVAMFMLPLLLSRVEAARQVGPAEEVKTIVLWIALMTSRGIEVR